VPVLNALRTDNKYIKKYNHIKSIVRLYVPNFSRGNVAFYNINTMMWLVKNAIVSVNEKMLPEVYHFYKSLKTMQIDMFNEKQ
jgi:hypothetical protein